MNLSTARASTRAKEIGIKKAVGAESRALIMQYLTNPPWSHLSAFFWL